jgi:hypothetical protein
MLGEALVQEMTRRHQVHYFAFDPLSAPFLCLLSEREGAMVPASKIRLSAVR